MEKRPIRHTRDKFDHFRAVFKCPSCGQFLAAYTYGRLWTDNGLAAEKRTDCPSCGQGIDWSGVPLPDEKED